MRDCSIRLVRACVHAYTYLYSMKYPRAYFGFVSKSRVNRTVVLKRKSWSFAVKSAKTRNRDNPISHKWCGRRGGGVTVIRTSEHVLCCFLRIFVLFYFIFFPVRFWWIARCGSCEWRARRPPLYSLRIENCVVVFSRRTPTNIDVTHTIS